MAEFGLIGDPISHSASPRLFSTAYNGRYGYDLIEGKYFEESYSRFLRSYKAINVTAPFKEAAYEKADIVSGPCSLIGAANILVKTDKGVACHNSDFTGIIIALAEELFPGITIEFYHEFGVDAHKKIHQFTRKMLPEMCNGRRPNALIVGCGGAGKAAAVAAAEMGCNTVILNRSIDKAAAFAKGLPEYKFRIEEVSHFIDEMKTTDLIIYTLPMALDSLDSLSANETVMEGAGRRVLLEANYRNPSFTGLRLARIQDAGFSYIGGMRWLVGQAISGYSIMTGEVPDVETLMGNISHR